MILEALQHLLTPAPRHVKEMGYVREALAINARAKRCRAAWEPHLEQCKKLILQAAEDLPPNARIMILGSGSLHDVPVTELTKAGYHLILVDIVHLPKTRKTLSEQTVIEVDLTDPEQRDALPDADLIVSLNVLSQLPLAPLKHAEKQGAPLPDGFAEQVMTAHLDWLRQSGIPTLLISDIAWHYYDGETLIQETRAIPDIGLPEVEWVWDVAPKGEADRKLAIRHQVGAWRLNY